jgi:hypothetical protein
MIYEFARSWLLRFVVRKEVVGESGEYLGRKAKSRVGCCNSAIIFARIFVEGTSESSTPALSSFRTPDQSHAPFHLPS